MVERATVISESQRARGLDTEGSFRARVAGVLPLVGPVIIASLTDVEERSLALESRAFSRPGRRHLFWAMPDSGRGRVAALGSCWPPLVAAVARGSPAVRSPCDARPHGVSYRYAGYAEPVLHDIDLTLADGEIVGVVGAERGGQVDALPRRVRPRARIDRRRADRGGAVDRRRADGGQPLHEFATRVGIGFQNPATQLSGVTGSVFEEVALGPMNLGLTRARRSSGPRPPWPPSASSDLAEREPRRLSGGQGQLVVIASLLAMRPAPPRPRRADGPARPRGDPAGRRGAPRTGRDRHGVADRRAQDGPARRPVRPGRRPSMAAGSSRMAPRRRCWRTTPRGVGRRAAVPRAPGPAPRGPRARPGARWSAAP